MAACEMWGWGLPLTILDLSQRRAEKPWRNPTPRMNPCCCYHKLQLVQRHRHGISDADLNYTGERFLTEVGDTKHGYHRAFVMLWSCCIKILNTN